MKLLSRKSINKSTPEVKLSPEARLEKFHRGQVGSVRNRTEVLRRLAEKTGESLAELCSQYEEEWKDENGKVVRSEAKKCLTKLMKKVRDEMVAERISAARASVSRV